MLIRENISQLTAEGVHSITTYHDCLARIICNPLPKCYLNVCDECPGIHHFKEQLTVWKHDRRHQQWVSVDRSSLETLTTTSDQFMENVCEKLEILLPRSFISSQQATFYSERSRENWW